MSSRQAGAYLEPIRRPGGFPAHQSQHSGPAGITHRSMSTQPDPVGPCRPEAATAAPIDKICTNRQSAPVATRRKADIG